MANKRICSIPACGKRHHSRGFCKSHYERQKLHGDPTQGGTAYGEPLRYLNEVVLTNGSDECLFWPYSNNGIGYGMVYVDGRKMYTHRLVCEKIYGPAPSPSHHAAHSCGRGHLGCCNPRHLNWATPSENEQDKLKHGTHSRGERSSSAKLTEDDVREIRELRGKFRQATIARMFRVSRSAVQDITTGKNWAWLDN